MAPGNRAGFVLFVLLDRTTVFFQLWGGISAWYPPVGLALALLVGLDLSYAPLLFLAGAIGSVVNYHSRRFPSPFGCEFQSPRGYTGAAYVLRRVLRIDTAFRSLRDVNWFVAVALASSFCVAAAGAAASAWGKTLRWDDYPHAALNWWVGDAVALVCLTPFLLIHVTPWLQRRGRVRDASLELPDSRLKVKAAGGSQLARRVESCAQACTILLSLWLVFGWNLVKSYDLFYLFFLPILWIAVRRGLRGVTLPSCSSTPARC